MDAISLNVTCLQASEARHFARMRSNHHGPIGELLCLSLESVQPVGIQNSGPVSLLHQNTHQFCGIGISRDSWPDGDHRLSVNNFFEPAVFECGQRNSAL